MAIIFRILIILISFIFFSCKTKTDYKQNFSNSSVVAFNLIKQCVDTMLNINPEINTANYVLDLSSIKTLNKQGVDSFLNIKNLTLPTISDDSTMIFKDANPENFRMKQSMIIKIREISSFKEKTVTVNASKIKSTSEIVDATIELERKSEGYQIAGIQIVNKN